MRAARTLAGAVSQMLPGRGPSAARQLRWALEAAGYLWALEAQLSPAGAAELLQRVAAGEPCPPALRPTALQSAAGRALAKDLVDPGFAARYLELSSQGLLRTKPAPRSGPLAEAHASTRARAAALGALALHLGLADPVPPLPQAQPSCLPEGAALISLRRALQSLTPTSSASQARLTALGLCQLALPLRPAALAVTRLRLQPGKARRPCDQPELLVRGAKLTLRSPAGEQVDLDAATTAGVTRYLDLRERLVQGRGGRSALWVSVAANHRPAPAGSQVLPPGLPLRPRGLERAWARAVARLNDEFLGEPGFPLPASLDLLRRASQAARAS